MSTVLAIKGKPSAQKNVQTKTTKNNTSLCGGQTAVAVLL